MFSLKKKKKKPGVKRMWIIDYVPNEMYLEPFVRWVTVIKKKLTESKTNTKKTFGIKYNNLFNNTR